MNRLPDAPGDEPGPASIEEASIRAGAIVREER
jgi:hypothetical protein